MSSERPNPDWLTRFAKAYLGGETIAYILHGDVEGIAFEGVKHRTLLHRVLKEKFDVVASYSLASGITIIEPDETIKVRTATGGIGQTTRRARALQLAGLEQAAAPTGGSVASQAARSLLPQSAPAPASGDAFAAIRKPLQAVTVLDTMLKASERVAVIIEHPEAVVPPSAMGSLSALSADDRTVMISLLEWAGDRTITRNGNPIFMIVKDLEDINPALRAPDAGWRALHLRLPNREERREYIEWYLGIRAKDQKPVELLDGLTVEELANNTAGLSLRHIEDVILQSAQAGGMRRAMVKEYKDGVITTSYSEVAQMIEPLAGGFADVGGMEPLKEWARTEVIFPVRAGRTNDVPKGICFVGPPGTGKTWFVRALARETNFNAVTLNASQILAGVVGESERRLAKFLGFVRALAPCLVFVDELDQTDMARRGNNSGNPVASNLFNALLQFMSDETLRGRVIMVFATNRPDLLDPALLRFGRMDAIVPVLLPEHEERKLIAASQAKAQGIELDDQQLELIAARTANYSNADLGAIVRKARVLAQREGATGMGVLACVERALKAIRPQTLSTADAYTALAVAACNDTEMLPARFQAMLDERDATIATKNELVAAGDIDLRRGRNWDPVA